MVELVLRGDGSSILIERVQDGVRVEALTPSGLTAWCISSEEAAAVVRTLMGWPR